MAMEGASEREPWIKFFAFKQNRPLFHLYGPEKSVLYPLPPPEGG
jgi:hypothetical protein